MAPYPNPYCHTFVHCTSFEGTSWLLSTLQSNPRPSPSLLEACQPIHPRYGHTTAIVILPEQPVAGISPSGCSATIAHPFGSMTWPPLPFQGKILPSLSLWDVQRPSHYLWGHVTTIITPWGQPVSIAILLTHLWRHVTAVAILPEQPVASGSPLEYPGISTLRAWCGHHHPFRAAQGGGQPSVMLSDYCAPFGSMLQPLTPFQGKTLPSLSLWCVCQLPPHVRIHHSHGYPSGATCGCCHPSRTSGSYRTPFGDTPQPIPSFWSN